MVPQDYEEIVTASHQDTQHKTLSAGYNKETSIGSQDGTFSCPVQLEGPELTEETIALMDNATRGSTKTKYQCVEKKWLRYCATNNIDTQATTNSLLNFMASEYNRKLSYNYIKGYAAPLAAYTKNVDFDLVRKLRKGMFNDRPPKPKYMVIWDVNIVLTFLSAMRTDTDVPLTEGSHPVDAFIRQQGEYVVKNESYSHGHDRWGMYIYF